MLKDSLNEWLTLSAQTARRQETIESATTIALTTSDINEDLKLHRLLIDEAKSSIKDYSVLKPLYIGTLALVNQWQTNRQINDQSRLIKDIETAVEQLLKIVDYEYTLNYRQLYHLMSNSLHTDVLHHIQLLKSFDGLWNQISEYHRGNIWLLERNQPNY